MKTLTLKRTILVLILMAALTLSSGCNLLPGVSTAPPSSPPATSQTTPPTPAVTQETGSDWTVPISNGESAALPNIADVIARVKPSVVAINVQITGFDPFLGPSTEKGAGSGWVIRNDGYIVTNNHVVGNATSVTVTLDDGTVVPATVVGTDALTDLAVVKIEAKKLTALTVGDSGKLRVGDWVVAIGNALGQGISATQGIVSSQGVSLPVSQGQTLYNLIQTDAAINPGNSGGPLVNIAGEVIGINSAKIAQVGVEGVGYAISTVEAIPIIEQLISKGFVVRPFLGVQGLFTVDQSVAAYFNLGVNNGALVRGIVRGGPAEKAGLQVGDVITRFNGQAVSNVDELTRAIHSAKIGTPVEITFWRGKTENTVSATLVESSPP